VTWSGHG